MNSVSTRPSISLTTVEGVAETDADAVFLKTRPASSDDISGIRAVGYELALQGSSGKLEHPYVIERVDKFFDRMWDVEYLKSILENPSAAFVVTECDEAIVGLAIAVAQETQPSIARLSRLCVRPSFRSESVFYNLVEGCRRFLPPSINEIEAFVPQYDCYQLRFYRDSGFEFGALVRMGNSSYTSNFARVFKKTNSAL